MTDIAKENAPIPKNEKPRLKALDYYDIMDTEAEESFDNLTKLASEICETPISLVSLLDKNRQWFKSRVGLDASETPREISFCQYAIMDEKIFEVKNALEDERFVENVLVTGDPNIRFYAGQPLIDENGFALGTLCVIDRVPKKLSEAQSRALGILAQQVVTEIESRKRRSELEKYRKFFDLSLEFLCISGTDGYFKELNPTFSEKLGYTTEELLSKPFTDFIHKDDLDKTTFEMHKLRKGYPLIGFENRYRKKDGTYIWLHWTCYPDALTGELFAAAHEITSLKNALNEIKILEFNNSAELQAINNAVIRMELSTDRKIISVNQNLSKFLGYADDIIDTEHKLLLFEEDQDTQEYEDFWTALLSNQVQIKEFRRKDKNGNEKWIKGSYIPVSNEKNKVVKIIKIAYDITDKKVFEEQLKKSNEELDQFAYIVSHDLKAPLRAISTLSTFLEEDLEGKLDEDSIENFNLLKSRVVRMESLINGILAYSKTGKISSKTSSVDTLSLVKTIVESLNVKEGFVINVDQKLPTIESSEIELNQVFQNLISNALKYHDKEQGLIEIKYVDTKKFHVFEVSDDGPGIDEQYHEKIFGIFQTLQSRDEIESTGIGLSIVKKIAEELGGSIKLKSTLGQGSTFAFHLPKTK